MTAEARLFQSVPDSKVHRANMGPTWGQQDPGGPHVGPMNLAIWVGSDNGKLLNKWQAIIWTIDAIYDNNIVMASAHFQHYVTVMEWYKYGWRSYDIRTWISTYIHINLMGGITCPTFQSCLTHLPLDKMATILQTIFSDAFSWMKSFEFWFRFHWSLWFLRALSTTTKHWFR